MNENLTKIEAAIARAEKALAEAREASAKTDQAIARAQDAIDKFWARQEAALARMRGGEKKVEQAEEKEAETEHCEGKCSCRDSGSRQEMDFYRAHALKSHAGAFSMTGMPPIDPDLLVDLVSDLLLLAGRMNEQIQAIERERCTTPKRKRRRRSRQKYWDRQF